MDIDDDDAFLYGDSSETVPDIKPKSEIKEEISVAPALMKKEQTSNNAAASTSSTSTTAPAPLVPSKVAASSGVSSAMAASLAAYGIDPSAAIIEPTFEDGGIEEEEKEDDDDDDEEEDDDDEDDVNFVFSGQTGRALDLRKAQQAPTNVIGIGKWAHTSTGQAPAADPRASATPQRATAPVPAPTANQTTEYVPAARPGPASATPADPYPQIPPSGDTGTAPNLLQPSSTSSSGIPGVPSLPHSSLPPVTAPSTHPKVDPSHPSGIIPSSGNSVYDIDLAQFEGSGQPWRRPGSDLSDWFNFGFDEVSFPKFLRFRAEMEAGRNAMMNAPPMAPITPEVIHMLNLSLPPQQQQNPMQHQNNFNLNPAMMQQMQQMMGMQGVDMGMMAQMMGNMGGGQGMGMQGQAGQQGQPGQGPGQGMIGQQGQMRQNQPQRPSATPGPGQNVPDQGEEVKQEDMDPTAEGYVEGTVPPPNMAMRGRGMMRGMPMRGTMMRGRGAAPLGPRAATMPIAVPKGPKAGRFRDKDRVESGVAGSLDYGGESRESDGGSRRGRSISRSRSPSDRSRSRTRSPRGRDRDRGREKSYSKSQSRSRSRTPPRSTIGGAESRDRTKSKSPEKKRSRRRDDSDSPPPPRSGKSSRRDRSESPYEKSRGRREKEKQRDRDRERSYRDKEREKEMERPKRKREDGSLSVGLGPSGWGDEEDVGEKRSSRKRRSYSSESEESYRGKSKRR